MKYILSVFILMIVVFTAQSQVYDHMNIDLLGHWTTDTLPQNGAQSFFSSCLAYEDNGREYAIVGASNGTYIMEVTNPAEIRFVDFISSPIKTAIWREYKTFKNYLYMISDDNGPNVMDIVDLSYLPDSVHVVYSGDEYLRRGHTVFVDRHYLYIGIRRALEGTNTMTVFDLSEDPTKPVELRSLDEDYPEVGQVHDMYVRNDTVYASCGYRGLHIFTFDGGRFHKLGEFTDYPFAGYNHSSILTPDGRTLIFTDEVPYALPAKSLDVTDPSNPILLDTFTTQTGLATPHNPFLPDVPNKFVMAGYMDGVSIFDYSNPMDIRMTGYFDTFYQGDGENTTGANIGTWSVDVTLPSKNIVAVDMVNGLFILDGSKAYDTEIVRTAPGITRTKIQVAPNPVRDLLQIEIPVDLAGDIFLTLIDQAGNKVITAPALLNGTSTTMDVRALPSGNYLLVVSSKGFSGSAKVVKI